MVGPTISTLAGISRMRIAMFVALATISLVVRMVLFYAFADAFREPIAQFLESLEDYRAPGTLLLIAGILVWQLVKRRRASSP
jgi:membrane protein DedA with SNARE-associated domain